MALDMSNHRLFIGCRHPPKLLVLDTDIGKLITATNADGDVDDIFTMQSAGEIYLSCGDGYIDIFKQADSNTYSLIEKNSSSARTSLFT
jgi:hypothetical protein